MDSNKIGNHFSTVKGDTGKVDVDSILRDSLTNTVKPNSTRTPPVELEQLLPPSSEIHFTVPVKVIELAMEFMKKGKDFSVFKGQVSGYLNSIIDNPEKKDDFEKFKQNVDKILSTVHQGQIDIKTGWTNFFNHYAQEHNETWSPETVEGLTYFYATVHVGECGERNDNGEFTFNQAKFDRYLEFLQTGK